MTREEAVERWAYIAHCVFTAEERIAQEWHERMQAGPSLPKEEQTKLIDEYCEAVAREVVAKTSDEELAEMT